MIYRESEVISRSRRCCRGFGGLGVAGRIPDGEPQEVECPPFGSPLSAPDFKVVVNGVSAKQQNEVCRLLDRRKWAYHTISTK